MDVRMVVMEKAWIADMDLVKDSMAEMEVGVVVSGEGGRKLLAISVVSCHGFFFARMEGWVWECRNRG